MEGNPFSVLEGLLIGAFASVLGRATSTFRQEYALAVENVGLAIQQAVERGLLGENILGSGF